MLDVISELLVTNVAAHKLAARNIQKHEVAQLTENRYVIARNRRHPRLDDREPGSRRLLIDQTNGGRTLTLVIQRTVDPTTWVVVTGWTATHTERRMLRR